MGTSRLVPRLTVGGTYAVWPRFFLMSAPPSLAEVGVDGTLPLETFAFRSAVVLPHAGTVFYEDGEPRRKTEHALSDIFGEDLEIMDDKETLRIRRSANEGRLASYGSSALTRLGDERMPRLEWRDRDAWEITPEWMRGYVTAVSESDFVTLVWEAVTGPKLGGEGAVAYRRYASPRTPPIE